MDPTPSSDGPSAQATASAGLDVLVIGAGLSGIYALHRLRKAGFAVMAIEAGAGPGGTWYWNRYPGARVDVESLIYSYSFDEDLQQEWHWTERFAPQPELEAYINHVVDRFDLRRYIRFSTRVDRLTFDERTNRWLAETDGGEELRSRFVVSATGSLHAANLPSIEGAEEFQGRAFHTAHWPSEPVDLAGRRIGVIGTGATGIQLVPVIAEEAGHLYVFQRSANFSLPSRNEPLDPEYERSYKANYASFRSMMRRTETAATLTGRGDRAILETPPAERERILEEAWNSRSGHALLLAFTDVRTDLGANAILAEFVRRKIRGIVDDPATAELLCPTDHPIGAKRICLDTGYYETFNRPNVTLVDVRRDPISRITPHGLETATRHIDLDVLIFATGFDALTGSLTRVDITGVNGITLRDRWRGGPRTYLGMVVASMPNLFMIHGPQSPSVIAQMIMGAEWQSDWITETITYMKQQGYERIDTTIDWEDRWTAEVEEGARHTLFLHANSWYVGANIPGKPRVPLIWTLGFESYTTRCTEAVERGYEGLVFSRPS